MLHLIFILIVITPEYIFSCSSSAIFIYDITIIKHNFILIIYWYVFSPTKRNLSLKCSGMVELDLASSCFPAELASL